MAATVRTYWHPEDHQRVSAFLVETYQREGQPANWVQPRWEYMHYWCVPLFGLKPEDIAKIGIWEDAGKIVGAVHFEERFGEAHLQIHPDYTHLKAEMLEYAESHLSAPSEDGTRSISAFISDFDEEFQSIARSRGYRKNQDAPSYMLRFDPRDLPPVISLPEGFALKSLADDNNRAKVNRVLHRGFNHAGEPPEGGIQLRQKLETAPNFRKELQIVVESPTGDFVSYCGMWCEPTNRFAMVEPVGTDPAYRRKGLGTAAVLKGIRRAADLGATVAYVGTDKPFYLAIGFKRMSAYYAWEKCCA